MNALKILLVFSALALVLAGCAGVSVDSGYYPANGMDGPVVSAPQIYMTPNGDRVGHYAPYFYPDH